MKKQANCLLNYAVKNYVIFFFIIIINFDLNIDELFEIKLWL